MRCYLVATVSWRESVLMSHGKRKQLPTSDPEYILSLLEGDSSGESDSDLYSESDDEDSFFSEASPTSSFQSYSSISHSPSIVPSVSPPTSSFQSYHTRASPAKSSLQASSTTVQASSQSLQALSSLCSPERVSDTTLPSQLHSNSSSLTGTPPPTTV